MTSFHPQRETPVIGAVLDDPRLETEVKQEPANEISTPGWEAARQFIAAAALRSSRAGLPAPKEAESEKPTVSPSTTRPSTFPLRLLTESEREARDQRRITDTREKTAPGSPAAPPPLDINAVADKVSDILMRRRRFELERKGR